MYNCIQRLDQSELTYTIITRECKQTYVFHVPTDFTKHFHHISTHFRKQKKQTMCSFSWFGLWKSSNMLVKFYHHFCSKLCGFNVRFPRFFLLQWLFFLCSSSLSLLAFSFACSSESLAFNSTCTEISFKSWDS